MSILVRKDLIKEYCLILLLLLQPILENAVPILSYIDETVMILALLYTALLVMVRKEVKIESFKVLFWLIILLLVGLVGNFITGANQPLAAIIQDIISNYKYFLFFICILSAAELSNEQKSNLSDFISSTVRVLILIMFVFAILTQFVDIGMSGDTRYGIVSFKFLLPNAAGLNTYCYSYAIMFSATLIKEGRLRKYSNLFVLMFIFVWLLTLRSRAFAFAAIYFVLYYLLIIKKTNRNNFKFKWYYLIPIVAIAFLLGWSTFEEYFINNTRQVRYVMAHTSVDIAKDYFPIGTGFGTFGTAASRTYYSEIYSRYLISSVWGIGQSTAYFILDQYWFGILGQFGIMGVAIVAKLIIDTYRQLWRQSEKNTSLQLATMVFIYTSLLASISAASYVQASIMLSMYMILKMGNLADKYVAEKNSK